MSRIENKIPEKISQEFFKGAWESSYSIELWWKDRNGENLPVRNGPALRSAFIETG
jgi:hypothetical protein